MYSVSEHSKYTSAIDKYLYFKNKLNAIKFCYEMVNGYNKKCRIDCDENYYYRDLYERDYIKIMIT